MLTLSGSPGAPGRTHTQHIEGGRGVRGGASHRELTSARILLIDPESRSRRPIREACEVRGYEVMEASEAREGRRLAGESTPSLIVFDTSGEGDNAEARALITDWRSAVPAILIGPGAAAIGLPMALELGADDYLMKPCRIGDLLARIEAHLRRMTPAVDRSPVLRFADLSVDPGKRRVQRGVRVIDLTRNEFDLLLLLASSAGTVFSFDRIVSHMWGSRSGGGRTRDLPAHSQPSGQD